MDTRPNLRQNETYYEDAAKWIVRGILIGAPRSVIEQYQNAINPLSLDSSSYGVDDKKVIIYDDSMADDVKQQYILGNYTLISKNEMNLLHKFINEMLALKPPKFEDDKNIQVHANDFVVSKVIGCARKYFDEKESPDHPKFNYFREYVSTITGNVSTRTVLLKYDYPDTNPIQVDPKLKAEHQYITQEEIDKHIQDREKLRAELNALIKPGETSKNIDEIELEYNAKDLDDFFASDSEYNIAFEDEPKVSEVTLPAPPEPKLSRQRSKEKLFDKKDKIEQAKEAPTINPSHKVKK